MSVTFSIKGQRCCCEDLFLCECARMNLANKNAAELLEALDYYDLAMDLYGEVRAKEVNLRIEKALAVPVSGDGDTSASLERREGGSWLIMCGRRSEYLSEKLRVLKAIAERAGDLGIICFG